MSKKIKIQLAITIGITIVLLLTSFFLIRAKANDYLSILDEMEGADWEDVEYGGLGFIAVVVMLVGAAISLLSLPLLAAAILLLPFFIILLIVKKEKTQEIVVLILMIVSILFTIVMLLYIVGLTYLFVIFAESTTTPILSFTLVILLSLTGISIVANTITVIVSYAKLYKYCNKLQNMQLVGQH